MSLDYFLFGNFSYKFCTCEFFRDGNFQRGHEVCASVYTPVKLNTILNFPNFPKKYSGKVSCYFQYKNKEILIVKVTLIKNSNQISRNANHTPNSLGL